MRGGRPDVWVTLYSSFFSGVARTWTLVDARLLCYNRYALSSPFCPPFHRPSLMNFCHVFFFISSNITSQSSRTCLVLPTHAYHRCCCLMFLSLLLSLLRRPLLRLAWEKYSLYNLSAPPHTFFRNFSRIHISSYPSVGLPQSSMHKKNPLSHRCA